ncbi:MAG: DUF2911 domain-containing protein [Flavobacteriaceae bacterium]
MNFIKKFLLLLAALVLIAVAYVVYGVYINPVSPKGTAEITLADTTVEVTYYRPYKNERLIFGSADVGALVPYDTYWRLGANFATVFETSSDLVFAGRPLSAGAYRMYAVPYADHWRLCLNDDAGAFGYNEPDYSKDVLCINIATQEVSNPLEQFTIVFLEAGDQVMLRMDWDTTAVIVPLEL